MAMKTGPQSKSDNKFTAKCRLLQSKYRAEVLKEPHGAGPTKNSKKVYGNMLVNGEETGSNFITRTAFDFAKEKVRLKKENKYLTIDEFRLFNNMLSSMPMCFNLFSDLRKLLKENKHEASRIIKQIFIEIPWIHTVTEIDVEFIPTPIEDYTNDKSAFDAMIIAETEDGQRGLISIETKYTDLLGTNTASDSKKKNELIETGGFFNKELRKELKVNGYKQIHRNFLLTYAYAVRNNFKYFINVILSPEEDTVSVSEIDDMKKMMTKYKDCIQKVSLQDFVDRGVNCNNKEIKNVMYKFKERYLNY
ncbi:hypothetical protein ACFL20_09350 [Spirochaetota bacterium]